MSPRIQTLIALALVALAAGGLAWRSFSKRRTPGCGSGCGCPTDDFKAKLKR